MGETREVLVSRERVGGIRFDSTRADEGRDELGSREIVGVESRDEDGRGALGSRDKIKLVLFDS